MSGERPELIAPTCSKQVQISRVVQFREQLRDVFLLGVPRAGYRLEQPTLIAGRQYVLAQAH